MFFEMRLDLGTLDSGERLLPFGLLVLVWDGLVFYSLLSTKIMFFIAVVLLLSSLWQLKVSIDFMPLFLSQCRYFDKSFTEMFLE